MIAWIRKNAFIIVLIVLFIAADRTIAWWDPISRYDVFAKNDFHRTLYDHPNPETWSHVVFGNSSIVASYDSRQSRSRYVNLGMNYGKLTDLDAMLKQKRIQIGEELILALNVFTLMDDLTTDPTYIWHKKGYEPYLYFYRDFIVRALDKYGPRVLRGEKITVDRAFLYRKELYRGQLEPDKLEEKITTFHENYGNKTPTDFHFSENLQALDRIIAYAKENEIRLRVLWMPWNPTMKSPHYVYELKEQVADKLATAGVPYTDWMDRYTVEEFHDLGHLNVERGRPRFTEELDEWIRSGS